MISSTRIIKPAEDISLISRMEAKIALGIAADDTTQDEKLDFMILRASGEISAYCNNRVFARETVVDTYSGNLISPRLWLSHFPVLGPEITNVSINGTPLLQTDYELDSRSGMLSLASGSYWGAPTAVEYTGGYDLPNHAHPALRQACLILVRDAYNTSLLGAAGAGGGQIRMLAHKESRIMYHPTSGSGAAAGGGAGGTLAANRAVSDLLVHFTHFYV
jgi:hypothetical protein